MQTPRSIAFNLYDQWLAEDDDGLNLIILDDRRKGIESCMQARLASEPSADTTEQGAPLYSLETLDSAFQACYLPQTSEPD